MSKEEKLEQLSDKVRMGIPIGFTEALEVIEYRENIKKNKKKLLSERLGMSIETIYVLFGFAIASILWCVLWAYIVGQIT